jgi:post-segregation antitoxin (ccd killing protein)
MKQYTERQVIKISKKQAESLAILKTYNVNVSQFIRAAIKKKLQKEWKTIKENKTKEYCPF